MVGLASVFFLITGKFSIHVVADQIFALSSAASEKPGEQHYKGKINYERRSSSTEEMGIRPAAMGV